ncbi:hypothetical protein LWI29_018691 [Acer saccharum]|uniref:Uncharacterized protein n=1 Tax=Acer saccharum TaxID=4024 RepID=A0AA39T0J1_ACESA|nr:hypothetical protein LWI29_018691 [Acer saccharum]
MKKIRDAWNTLSMDEKSKYKRPKEDIVDDKGHLEEAAHEDNKVPPFDTRCTPFKPSSKVRDGDKGDVERKVMLCLDVISNIKAIREGILMDAMCESGFASFMCGIRCMWGV